MFRLLLGCAPYFQFPVFSAVIARGVRARGVVRIGDGTDDVTRSSIMQFDGNVTLIRRAPVTHVLMKSPSLFYLWENVSRVPLAQFKYSNRRQSMGIKKRRRRKEAPEIGALLFAIPAWPISRAASEATLPRRRDCPWKWIRLARSSDTNKKRISRDMNKK